MTPGSYAILILAAAVALARGFECPGYGRYADASTKGCRDYVYCAKTTDGRNLTLHFTCPEGTLFNPGSSKCESEEVFKCDDDDADGIRVIPLGVGTAAVNMGDAVHIQPKTNSTTLQANSTITRLSNSTLVGSTTFQPMNITTAAFNRTANSQGANFTTFSQGSGNGSVAQGENRSPGSFDQSETPGLIIASDDYRDAGSITYSHGDGGLSPGQNITSRTVTTYTQGGNVQGQASAPAMTSHPGTVTPYSIPGETVVTYSQGNGGMGSEIIAESSRRETVIPGSVTTYSYGETIPGETVVTYSQGQGGMGFETMAASSQRETVIPGSVTTYSYGETIPGETVVTYSQGQGGMGSETMAASSQRETMIPGSITTYSYGESIPGETVVTYSQGQGGMGSEIMAESSRRETVIPGSVTTYSYGETIPGRTVVMHSEGQGGMGSTMVTSSRQETLVPGSVTTFTYGEAVPSEIITTYSQSKGGMIASSNGANLTPEVATTYSGTPGTIITNSYGETIYPGTVSSYSYDETVPSETETTFSGQQNQGSMVPSRVGGNSSPGFVTTYSYGEAYPAESTATHSQGQGWVHEIVSPETMVSHSDSKMPSEAITTISQGQYGISASAQPGTVTSYSYGETVPPVTSTTYSQGQTETSGTTVVENRLQPGTSTTYTYGEAVPSRQGEGSFVRPGMTASYGETVDTGKTTTFFGESVPSEVTTTYTQGQTEFTKPGMIAENEENTYTGGTTIYGETAPAGSTTSQGFFTYETLNTDSQSGLPSATNTQTDGGISTFISDQTDTTNGEKATTSFGTTSYITDIDGNRVYIGSSQSNDRLREVGTVTSDDTKTTGMDFWESEKTNPQLLNVVDPTDESTRTWVYASNFSSVNMETGVGSQDYRDVTKTTTVPESTVGLTTDSEPNTLIVTSDATVSEISSDIFESFPRRTTSIDTYDAPTAFTIDNVDMSTITNTITSETETTNDQLTTKEFSLNTDPSETLQNSKAGMKPSVPIQIESRTPVIAEVTNGTEFSNNVVRFVPADPEYDEWSTVRETMSTVTDSQPTNTVLTSQTTTKVVTSKNSTNLAPGDVEGLGMTAEELEAIIGQAEIIPPVISEIMEDYETTTKITSLERDIASVFSTFDSTTGNENVYSTITMDEYRAENATVTTEGSTNLATGRESDGILMTETTDFPFKIPALPSKGANMTSAKNATTKPNATAFITSFTTERSVKFNTTEYFNGENITTESTTTQGMHLAEGGDEFVITVSTPEENFATNSTFEDLDSSTLFNITTTFDSTTETISLQDTTEAPSSFYTIASTSNKLKNSTLTPITTTEKPFIDSTIADDMDITETRFDTTMTRNFTLSNVFYETTTTDAESTTDGDEETPTSTTATIQLFDFVESDAIALPPNFMCTQSGRFLNPNDTNCRSYILCIELPNGTFAQFKYSCADNTYFSEETRSCVADNSTCPGAVQSANSTSTTVITRTSQPKFICTSIGRFPDPSAPDCTSYILCVSAPSGEFVQYNYRCLEPYRFDPYSRECSLNYDCSSPPPTASSVLAPPLTTPTTLFAPHAVVATSEFVCTSIGRFPDDQASNCRGYVMCARNADGTFAKHNYLCAGGARFDPHAAACDERYACQHVAESIQLAEAFVPAPVAAAAATALDPSSSQQNSGGFACTSIGRFPDPSVPDCAGYVLCLRGSGGAGFAQYRFLCQPPYRFDSISRQCGREATCATLVVPAYAFAYSAYAFAQPAFACNSAGRFLDPAVPGCAGYVMCARDEDGSLREHRYRCPEGARFNPTALVCSPAYACPAHGG